MFLDDDENSNETDIAANNLISRLDTGNFTKSTKATTLQSDKRSYEPSGSAPTILDCQTPDEVRSFTFAPDSDFKQSIEVRREELLVDHNDKDSLINKLGIIVAASKHTSTNPRLQKRYKLSGIPYSDKENIGNEKMEITPPETPRKSTPDMHVASPSPSNSSLSDIPSNLSEQDTVSQVSRLNILELI
jgi:hypothetical protein